MDRLIWLPILNEKMTTTSTALLTFPSWIHLVSTKYIRDNQYLFAVDTHPRIEVSKQIRFKHSLLKHISMHCEHRVSWKLESS